MAETAPAKKMLIMSILDILKRYTDPDHTLSQKQIMDILWSVQNKAAPSKTRLLGRLFFDLKALCFVDFML